MKDGETNEFFSYDSREYETYCDFKFELDYLLSKCIHISGLKTKIDSELEMQIFAFNYSSSKENILYAVENLMDIAETMVNIPIYDSCPVCKLKSAIRLIERRLIDNSDSLQKRIKIGGVTSDFYESILEMFKLEAILRDKGINNSQRIVDLFLRIITNN